MTPATLFNDLAKGPADGEAWWLTTSDAVRIRVAGWGKSAPKGTVLIFPGRTEYIEKYGPTAQDFLDRGFASVAIDWRGQGLADRLLEDRQLGHVGRFSDYQKDVVAFLHWVKTQGYPEPYYLVAHSMGGCIGYRALVEGLPVQAVVFSGPMWDVLMPFPIRPLAPAITALAKAFGRGTRLIPTGNATNYVQIQPFEGNTLTTNPEMYAFMQSHLAAHPELGIGGPTNHWLSEALREMAFIQASQAPDYPCLCYLGTEEKIVDPAAIHKRMARWPGAELIEVAMAEHEVLLEAPETRHRICDEICAFFDKHDR